MLLTLLSKRMRLAPSVNLEDLAAQTEGASGADLKGLCTLAGRNAFLRVIEMPRVAADVTKADFEQALREFSAREAWMARQRHVGFHAGAAKEN
jgi:ATP-dependent 26S proteasome regulatory subunit